RPNSYTILLLNVNAAFAPRLSTRQFHFFLSSQGASDSADVPHFWALRVAIADELRTPPLTCDPISSPTMSAFHSVSCNRVIVVR
ncbi:hypothetical protein CVT26_004636, partial [Gymnopilus dilepis]